MPNIAQHPSANIIKALLIGDSGAGKTGALMSLAAAGYKLRIVDLDNGMDIIRGYATDPQSPYVKKCPDIANNIEYQTLTDPMRNAGGRLIPAKATVWPNMVKILDHWKDPESGLDLGPVSSWGPSEIIVIDSLSKASEAAVNYHLAMNNVLGGVRTQNEGRRDIGVAQNMIRDLLTKLYDKGVNCNVIVISHVTMVTEVGAAPQVVNGELVGGNTPVGYPSAIGRALSPHIPRWFNSMLVMRTIGVGNGTKRKIYTQSQNTGSQIISAKTSAPLKVKAEYDIDWGLSEYFTAVKG